MLNRVQLSLIIEDNDVFNNLVIPSKQSKDLHPLCIRLLSAYYYNEEVRNLVDGITEDYEEVSDSPVMDAINNLRNNLAMQAFLGSDLAQILENGAEDIADIATGATVSVPSDNSNIKVEFSKNSAGNTSVRLLTDSQEEITPKNLTKAVPTNSKEPDALFLINYLARKLNIDLSGAYNDSSQEVKSNNETSVVSETVMEEEKVEVHLTEPISEIKNENVSDMFNEDYNTEAEPIEEDASGAIGDLLGSLFG